MQERVDALCIVADDSVFLTLLVAHLSKTSHVISLFPGLREKGAHYLQAVAEANGFSMDRVEVLEKRKTCLTMHDTHQKEVIPSQFAGISVTCFGLCSESYWWSKMPNLWLRIT